MDPTITATSVIGIDIRCMDFPPSLFSQNYRANCFTGRVVHDCARNGVLDARGWNAGVKVNNLGFAVGREASTSVRKRQEFGNAIAKRLEGAARSSA